MLRRILVVALLAVLVTAAAPLASAGLNGRCATLPKAHWTACAVTPNEAHARAGAEGWGADGSDLSLTVSQGSGFYGDYLYTIGGVHVAGTARVHGGLGFADRDRDGVHEDACACGGVQTTFLFVPWGIGLEDTDGDGLPDHPYILPQV